MRELFAPLLTLLLVASSAASTVESGTTVGLVVVMIAAVAVLVTLAHLTRDAASGSGALIRSEGASGITPPSAQSDPDAPGRARPRAPGSATSVA